MPVRSLPLVLVVDDYVDNRELYAEYLRHVGFEVEIAEDGNDAVALTYARRPTFIVMDLSMPGLDGWEATKLIRRTVGSASPYIIALSGFADAASQKRALDAGCDEFLAKPLLPSDLGQRLLTLNEKRSRPPRLRRR